MPAGISHLKVSFPCAQNFAEELQTMFSVYKPKNER